MDLRSVDYCCFWRCTIKTLISLHLFILGIGFSAWISGAELCKQDESRKFRGIDPEERLCCDFGHPCCPQLSSISFSTTQGKGVGFNKGYSSIGLIRSLSLHPMLQSFTFVEGDVHLFNDCKMAANLGLAFRAISNDQETVYGANIFYDVRQAKRFLQQMGCGLEVLGEHYALSINGYFPLHKYTTDRSNAETFTYPDGYYITYKLQQRSMAGADILVSTRHLGLLSCSGFELDFALGAYYYKREFGRSITGARIGLEICSYESVSLNVEASYDSYFDARTLVGLSVNFPYGDAVSPCARKGPYPSCCSYPIQRQRIVAQTKRYLASEQNF